MNIERARGCAEYRQNCNVQIIDPTLPLADCERVQQALRRMFVRSITRLITEYQIPRNKVRSTEAAWRITRQSGFMALKAVCTVASRDSPFSGLMLRPADSWCPRQGVTPRSS